MKRQEALNKNGGITSILDVPEQIFRRVFRHISIHELFTTVRNVNSNVRKYVDDFLSLAGVFLLIKEQGLSTRLIHIFKPKGSNFVTVSSLAQPFPVSDHSSYMKVADKDLDTFPPAFPSTEIQGPLLFGLHSGISFRSDLSVYKRPIAGKVAVDLSVFDLEKSRWKLLKTRYANINGRIVSCLIFTEEDGFVKAENHKHSVEEQKRVCSGPFNSSTVVLLS